MASRAKRLRGFPTVDHVRCIGGELCFVTCGRGVYDVLDQEV
jgi:formate hydrogenlyase subunit 6/NADH:ubiquinone oxidoreductase subunit I